MGELALIGRAAETEIIDRLLGDAFSGRSGVLVLTGEAGVGKSALLAYARTRAGGMGVLQTAGVQSEAEIEFAALYQLLRPALDGVGSLPPPQSAALGAALGVEPGRPANRFLIGAAVLSLLSAAASDRPLLCLADDAEWLDYESAVALAFAARRLEAEAVVVIVAARSVAGTPFAGFPARQIEGLSRSQAETLLAAHHPRVDPLIRERLIERADGNPLALLEFANQLQDAAQLAPPFAVRLAPTAVESLYLEQVRRLPDDTQLLLLVAAAEDSQALGLIIRAGSRLGLELRALEPAEQAGIVSVAGDQIMFGHPLARSATYTGAAFAQRQRVHKALADACGQEEPDRGGGWAVMRPFSYVRAGDAGTAIALVRACPDSAFLAGGTTEVDLVRQDVLRPGLLVDINDLPLGLIEDLPDGGLRIGALARMSDVARAPGVIERFPVISQALVLGASAQLRNMASMGGNLCQRVRCSYFRDPASPCNKRDPGSGCAALNGFHRGHAILGTSDHCIATHPSDVAVPLTALDAVVHTNGPGGERAIGIDDFFLLPGDTPQREHPLEHAELITAIEVPGAPVARRSVYLKFRDRQSYEFALASVAAAVRIEDGAIAEVRLALGGVGTRPWRARRAEAALLGRPASAASFAGAAREELAQARPRPMNTFKVELAQRAIVRALNTLTDGDR